MRTFPLAVTMIIPLMLVPAMSMAEEPWTKPPQLRFSLRDTIQDAIDNNVNVPLPKARITAAWTGASALRMNVAGWELPELKNNVTGVLGG